MKKIILLSYFIIIGKLVNGQTFTQSNLPILKITTRNQQAIPDEPKIIANLQVIDNGTNAINFVNDTPNGYNGLIGIEQRGSTSREFFPKKPYGFELWKDTLGTSQNLVMLGMPQESDWVLNASYNDKTFMRDVLAYRIANQMGRYATRTRYCELMLNGKYEGVYIVMEKIKRDKNRVNIANLKPTDNTGDDLTGGYIIKIDKTNGSPAWSWNSKATNKVLFQVDSPKYTDLTDAQLNYIKNFVDNWEKELASPTFLDPQAAWRSKVDMDSFVDYFLLTELTKNVDGYRLSTYFYKDKDSKDGRLKMGPAWDYNLAFGNADYYDGYKTSGWQYKINTLAPNDAFWSPFWWESLVQDPDFVNRAAYRWQQLRKTVLQTDKINQWIDSTASVITPAVQRNFSRWTGVLGNKVWPNYYVGYSYQDEVFFLKEWIRSRSVWLDAQFESKAIVLGNEPLAVARPSLEVFPNPIQTHSQVRYEVLEKGFVQLELYDLAGQKIQTLVAENQAAGTYTIPLNATLQHKAYIIDYQHNGMPIERTKILY